MRVIVCGSRDWTDYMAIERFLEALATSHDRIGRFTVVHGGARGAGRLAGRAATKLGLDVEAHFADWEGHGRKAGFVRNKLMADLGADLCVAFKKNFDPTLRKGGTEHMIKIAMEAGVRTIVLPVDPRPLAAG